MMAQLQEKFENTLAVSFYKTKCTYYATQDFILLELYPWEMKTCTDKNLNIVSFVMDRNWKHPKGGSWKVKQYDPFSILIEKENKLVIGRH